MKNPRSQKIDSIDQLEGFDSLEDDQKKQVEELLEKLKGINLMTNLFMVQGYDLTFSLSFQPAKRVATMKRRRRLPQKKLLKRVPKLRLPKSLQRKKMAKRPNDLRVTMTKAVDLLRKSRENRLKKLLKVTMKTMNKPSAAFHENLAWSPTS